MKGKNLSAPVAIAIVVGGALLMFAASHMFEVSPAQLAFREIFD